MATLNNNAINSPALGGFTDGGVHSALLLTNASTNDGPIRKSASMAVNGALFIGGTSGGAVGNLTAGAGISVTNSDAGITIAATGSDVFTVVSGTSQSLATGGAYLAVNSAATTFTLPAAAAVGTTIRLVSAGANVGGWLLKSASSIAQTVQVGNLVSVASSGSTSDTLVASSSLTGGDCIELVCSVANTTWIASSSVGSLTVTTA